MINRQAFTMVELIFVIVIIGILASVAIPKLSSIKDGAKKSAEIATISAVATALDGANGEWSVNEGNFYWGNHQNSTTTLNSVGYPTDLNDSRKVFGGVIKGNNSKFKNVSGGNGVITTNDNNISIFTGPASDAANGVKFDTSAPNQDIPDKPDKNDFWVYASYINDLNGCTISCSQCNEKIVFSGDLVLIDVNGTGPRPTPTCN
jgi:prepilin-type N-terminal cleavage/methylation domain-containing protein